MKLVRLSLEHRDKFAKCIEEMLPDGDEFFFGFRKSDDFEQFVKRLDDYSRGENLPKNFVPAITFMIEVDGEFVGTIDLRHHLTEALEKFGGHVGYRIAPKFKRKGYATKALELLLPIAKSKGISRLLITCSQNNLGSLGVIENNDGTFLDAIPREGGGITNRYFIDLETVLK